VQITIGADGRISEAVFNAPPAFGSDSSKVILEDLVIGGTTLSVTAKIDFGDDASFDVPHSYED
jgi:hypothetical protein